jgi:hypothetical protein
VWADIVISDNHHDAIGPGAHAGGAHSYTSQICGGHHICAVRSMSEAILGMAQAHSHSQCFCFLFFVTSALPFARPGGVISAKRRGHTQTPGTNHERSLMQIQRTREKHPHTHKHTSERTCVLITSDPRAHSSRSVLCARALG